MPSLTVIVVTHNRLEYTKRTIESLKASVPEAMLVVVDNVSTEAGFQEYLDSLEKVWNRANVHIIRQRFNGGWASAVNDVVAIFNEALGDFVLISNNDAEYKDGWFDKLIDLYDKYPNVGIMGVWKHRDHGVTLDHGDMEEKGDMPAVGWLMKCDVLIKVGPIGEKGPCATKGGNGEDSDYVEKVRSHGYLIGAPKEDVAIHIDGY